MEKIKDERLVLKHLKNIRVLWIVQTAGIIAILAYDLITSGLDEMLQNPLWVLFMIITILSMYLSMSISVDHESEIKSSRKGLLLSLGIVVLVSVGIGIATAFSNGMEAVDGFLIGGIIFLCCLAPLLYIFFLRKKRQEDR